MYNIYIYIYIYLFIYVTLIVVSMRVSLNYTQRSMQARALSFIVFCADFFAANSKYKCSKVIEVSKYTMSMFLICSRGKFMQPDDCNHCDCNRNSLVSLAKFS